MSKSYHGDCFIIESGFLEHIAKDLDHFSPVEETGLIEEHRACNSTITTKHQCSVLQKVLTRQRGSTKTTSVHITNLLYISKSAMPILSCLRLHKSGISTSFENGNCSLIDRHEKNVVNGSALPLECEGLNTLDAKYRLTRVQ